MRKPAIVVFLLSTLWMVSAKAEEATKLREEISVPDLVQLRNGV